MSRSAVVKRAGSSPLVRSKRKGGSPGVEPRLDFDAFYLKEYNRLIGLGYVLTGNRDVADDLVQEAFTEAHKRWTTVAGYEHPEAWIRRVLVNKATSRGRRLVTESRMLTRIRVERAPEYEMSEPTSELWAAVRRLPRRQSQAVALYYWDDLPIAQIGDVLGCTDETVKTHLKRGRARLATLVDDEGSLNPGADQ